MATVDKITTTPEERKLLLAELNKKLSQWDADCAADVKESERMKTEHEAMGRRFDADKLVRDLYGTSYGHDELRIAVETALADLPTAPLDAAELARLERRHLALRVVEKIAVLRPLSAPTEISLTQTFEKVLAPQIEIQEGKNHE
jgi:hypothetical protein